jgi:ArsR family transcriptional regulator
MAKTKSLFSKKETRKLEKIASILKTVAHPTRLGIINLLDKHGSLSVGDICKYLETEQSLTSHHLLTMRLRGLIKVKRDGRSMMYSIKERDLVNLIDCLENCNVNM